MSLRIKKAGLLDTIQDRGRIGGRKYGINANGVMDQTALRSANILLGNAETEAAIEIHFPAPVIEFRKAVGFVLTGADFTARLDGEPITQFHPQNARKGSILKFARKASGNRCYLSVKNGFQIENWLSSASTNLAAGAGGFEGRALRTGDEISFESPAESPHQKRTWMWPIAQNPVTLRYVPGRAFNDLTAISELQLSKSAYTLGSDSNRMGYRLEGPRLSLLDDSQRLSSAVTCGSIQVLPDGQLIMLMADHQTTGGYPNIGTVIAPDIPIAAQLGTGDEFIFKKISAEMAEAACEVYERGFGILRAGLRLLSK